MKTLFPAIPCLQSDRLILKEITEEYADDLGKMTESPSVYRYLPTFLFEKKYKDIHKVIRELYRECLEESLILGIFMDDQFCGLIEMYGYRAPIHKISIGYRLSENSWGKGIATEALGIAVDYLIKEKKIEIITASTMPENEVSAGVLRMNGFELVVSAVNEDWGYEQPTPADKWIR